LRQVLYGSYRPDHLPSQIVRPRQGRLLWMIDEAASTGHEPPPPDVPPDEDESAGAADPA
ncbi:MAG: hypothetical protein JW910_17120, partial [Anaerolineae bacterium]|nr:hypothetical protein [Anaerolineae bacterium]